MLLLEGCGGASTGGVGGGVVPDWGLPAYWILAQVDAACKQQGGEQLAANGSCIPV